MAVIKVLDVNKFAKGLKPVTSTELKTRTGEFNSDGLLSEEIFGVEGSIDRSKKMSYIELNATIIHPTLYRHIIKLERKLEKMFSTESGIKINPDGSIEEDENGISGISAFIENFKKIKFRDLGSIARTEIIKNLQQAYKDGTLFIDKLPVIPPDIRPVFEDETGKLIVDELVDIYIGILRKTFQIKSAGTKGEFYDLLSYGLQLAINGHNQFIQKKIEKKSGLIRGNMLGKRVDFSARAVITPGPQLDVNEVGIPLRIAVFIFQPFIIHHMIFNKKYPFKTELEEQIKAYDGSDLSVESLQRVLKSIKNKDSVPDKLFQLVFDATELVMKDRAVILKRDPVLHDLGVRGVYPKLVTGDTMQLATFHTGGFNADFDGDQMAVYHPLTRQAQDEIKEKMMKIVSTKNMKSVTIALSKEMNTGIYVLTKDTKLTSSPVAVTPEILEKATDPYIPVTYRGKNTTMGRAILNSVFPPDFEFINKPVTGGMINDLMPVLINKYGEKKTKEIYSKLEKIAFKFVTIIAPSFELKDLDMPPEIAAIKEKIKTATPTEAFKLIEQGQQIIKKRLDGTGVKDLIDSGASKGWDQPSQILIAKGVIADPQGRVLDPISSSFSDGLKPTEYFKASSGARKGMVDRALNTGDTGYFNRKLVYLLNSVEASPSIKDCGTKRTIPIRLSKDYIGRLDGRYIQKPGGRIIPFKKEDYKIGDTIHLRTPIYCESKKVCHTCYGELLKRHKSPFIGVIAGSAIGERGTQLIMRTFHTGGAATMAKHDIFEDIIQNDPLVNLEK
jgi:DNA-directed RNA polymerase subunit beta'